MSYIKSDELDMIKISIWQALDLVFIISDRSDLILFGVAELMYETLGRGNS
jgi:hypothetical protein